ncbi:MAG: hypothetical protein JWQ18_3730 [Conexibacter sp.]|nr:hypothetical protein [Conexibacter sp.]
MIQDARPISQRLLAFVVADLAWLEEDGYAHVRTRDLETRFQADYAGEHGRVSVSIDAARNNAEIWLAPPSPVDPAAPIDFLRGEEPRVMLEAVLMMYELPVPPGRWGSPDGADAAVARYVGALKQLRAVELAGDWSRFEEARAAGRRVRRDAVEQVRDPQMRAIMRGMRRRSPPGG